MFYYLYNGILFPFNPRKFLKTHNGRPSTRKFSYFCLSFQTKTIFETINNH
jgi:hypothetical protein